MTNAIKKLINTDLVVLVEQRQKISARMEIHCQVKVFMVLKCIM